MNAEEIKETVRRAYAEAALGESDCRDREPRRGGGCCDASPQAGTGGARSAFGCGDPLALLDVRPGQRVLDVGSGPGEDALEAARRVGPEGRVIGVDMTEEMLARARRAAQDAGLPNVEFRAGDAEALPVEDASVDWVISNCVVNLVPDKEAAFREIFRVLKPGGWFQITDLVGEDLPPEVLSDPERWCACVAGAPSEEAYLGAIRRAGFSGVSVLDRFSWSAPELEGTGGRVWSLLLRGRRPPGAPLDLRVEPARPEDLPAVLDLLRRCTLPLEGVAEHLGGFLLARSGGDPGGPPVGCAGLEARGSSAVLRSLAVSPEERGRGIARCLMDALLERARQAGCTDAYLLTLNLESMAARRGFQRIGRDALPDEVLESPEASLACCASAALMHRRID